ncbi:MAG: carbohydrate-binding protein [Verrucomicrobiae bacterium]|nr:carbohydrate-binding protein [Verrucomicrobiae bacterium]
MKPALILLLSLCAGLAAAFGAEYHVAPDGDDQAPGTRAKPFRTIQRAAAAAQPGDTVTVHAGTYRERINPPRGGTSDRQRITFQAAKGERVEIKGSEVIKNWVRVSNDVWKVTLPNALFGDFNPYRDVIRGDWFNPKGRVHHTGAVYLNGDWLIEAAQLDDLFLPAGETPAWLQRARQGYLLNVAWFRPVPNQGAGDCVPATRYSAKKGTQNAPCSEGGDCVGFIEHGHWLRFDNVDFGARTESLEVRGASAAQGGLIEFHLDRPDGPQVGRVVIPHTGDWQGWETFTARVLPLSGRQTVYFVFKGLQPAPLSAPLWFGQVNETHTTLFAQFPRVNPNEELVEINVRRTVFYPDQPGRNYITVRGFVMRHAATPWAPPTAEQVGLIGTHWSKGWIIENNIISHSICSGIALGKHGDKYDNTSADTAEGYVETIKRAHAHPIPWTREHIGHHVVRSNHISHCEQTAIVGSLGSAFCTVTDNVIHDIHVRELFTGAEMAGIKFHGAIDTVIRRNHIYRTCRGLWLDWMAQGTRVTQNLFHDNAWEDVFMEVNHGPFLVDNNIFLSNRNLLDMSEGGAYVHNLFSGHISNRPEPSRDTPYHRNHTTAVAGLAKTTGGDNRFYNNIFVGPGQITPPERRGNLKELRWVVSHGLWGYDGREFPTYAAGNVYLHGAEPTQAEKYPLVLTNLNPHLKLEEQQGRFFLHFAPGSALARAGAGLVSSELLGRARVPNEPYVNPDGSPLKIDVDYFGKKRSPSSPTPGPFEKPGGGPLRLRVW